MQTYTDGMKLPSATELRLLILVAASECSGRDVAKRFKKETGKVISYGTLYTTFRRLREQGWVTVREDEDEDGRMRWFRITASGLRAVVRARDHHRGLADFAPDGGEVRP